jgi:predicted DNA-binding transcriptional regulator AlpA
MAKLNDNPLLKDALLVSAAGAAALIGVGRSHFYAMHSSGRLGPMPVRLGRRTLWRRDDAEMSWLHGAGKTARRDRNGFQ